MLSTPRAGWTTFQLGKKESFALSYLTDVANDWLTQAIHGLETMDVFSVHGFCEPGRMVCTVSFWSCYVIFEDDGPAPVCEGVNHLHISMMDFCRQLHADISRDLEEWVRWEEDEPDDAEERRSALQSKLDRLGQLIRENEENFGDGACFL